MAEGLSLRGTLKGHNGWVTQIATNPQDPDKILSGSRGTYIRIRKKDERRVLLKLSLVCFLVFLFRVPYWRMTNNFYPPNFHYKYFNNRIRLIIQTAHTSSAVYVWYCQALRVNPCISSHLVQPLLLLCSTF